MVKSAPVKKRSVAAVAKSGASAKSKAPVKPAPKRAPVAKKAPAAVKRPLAKKVAVKKTAAKKPAATAPVSNTSTVAKPVQAAAAKLPAAGKDKAKKSKLVRDSFTMPELEYAALGEVKKACLKAGVAVKKSELLRIGVAQVRSMELAALKQALAALAPLKAGRPKKSK